MKKFGFAPLLLAIFLCLLLPAAARDIGSADALVSLMNDPAAWLPMSRPGRWERRLDAHGGH